MERWFTRLRVLAAWGTPQKFGEAQFDDLQFENVRRRYVVDSALSAFRNKLELICHAAQLRKRTGLHLSHQVGAMHLHRGFGDADVVRNLLV
jgi:hypothetical protein